MTEMNTNVENSLSSSVTQFVCISDNYDCNLPNGDILLHSGDFTCNGTEGEIETFLNCLKTIILVNHESKRFYTKKRYKKTTIRY